MRNVIKKRYQQGFGIVVVLLAVVRCIFPHVAMPGKADVQAGMDNGTEVDTQTADSLKIAGDVEGIVPVSYTHLTLPTNREV